MGDRILYQVVSKYDRMTKTALEFSPVVYGHNSGHNWKEDTAKLAKKMRDRSDVQYAAARLIQIMIGDHPFSVNDNCGFGIWNIDRVLTADDTHGDAGVVLIDADNGYLTIPLCGYSKRQQEEE